MNVKELTEKYMAETKKLSGDQLQRKCLKWILEPKTWNGFGPQEIPTKPEIVKEFENIPYFERKKLDSSYYRDNPEILDFYSKRDMAIAKNEHLLNWLNDMKVYCQTEEELHKLKQKMADFRKTLAYQKPEKYGYADETINKYKKEFQGEVPR